jgi:tetratricopeptide (TPR) repeat protein/O-antigen ligase
MNALEKTLRWIVLIGLFAAPFICLLVTTSLFFPYITGKNFAFRIITEIITGSWLALAFVNASYRPKRSWVFAALTAFVAIMAVADAAGVMPFKSFWSNFERMDGWITLIHVLALVFVAACMLNTEKLWKRLFQTSLGVSVYCSLYGLLQLAGITAIGQAGASGGLSARVDATFGNPIYLAIYMLFHIFLAALLWAQHWADERGRDTRFLASWAYGAVIVLDTLALLFSGTRGTILGLAAGTILAALIFAFFSGSQRARRYSLAAVAIVVVLAAGIYLGRESALVRSVGFLDRLASISTTDTTISARFVNMSIAWQGVKERPILGWGQENFAIVWDKYYDPRLYNDEPWFDRVHNIIFDWWIAGGTLGLLAYLSVFVAVLWVLWREGARSGSFTLAERALLTGLLAGYFVHNLTVFDNITSYILFAFLLGYIIYRSSRDARPLIRGASMKASALPYVTICAAALVWGSAWYVNAAALAENRTLLDGLRQQSSISTNLALFQKAISYGSIGTQEAREQLSQGAVQVSQTTASNDQKQAFFEASAQAMGDQMAESPLDARFPLFLGTIYSAYGQDDAAMQAFTKAHELSPQKQAILFLLGQTAWAQGKNSQALQYFQQAYELETSYMDAKVYYAAAAIRAGQTSFANSLIQELMKDDKAADLKIVAAYDAIGQISRAIPIWQAHVQASPQDVQGYFTLAALYYKTGNRTAAIQALRQAESANPAVATQAEALIKEIQNGTADVD